ncbi:MAG: hypothetical protein FJ033_09195 [Chloroflexi bacterium]|nr:hypothetical protein [Chloroflexota bacterium]
MPLARQEAARFPGGVAFVDLTTVGDVTDVYPAICRAVGLREPTGISSEDHLHAALRQIRLLLLLDNFEQV